MAIIPGQATGRREINWDGGSPTNATTTLTGTPLTTFLNTRGANITTRGSGFVQAPASGLADTFGNSSYATIFHAFSPGCGFLADREQRHPSRVLRSGQQWQHAGDFHWVRRGFYRRRLPGWQRPERSDREPLSTSTLIQYFGITASCFSPTMRRLPQPGDGNLSFIGVVFSDARIAE